MKRFLALLAVLLGNTANADTFQYLYIEANEGSSSGGHVAVQFGDDVFHYQFKNGLIRLFKQDAEGFRFDYRVLQNRTLHVADVDVSAATFNLLQDHFKLLFWQQDRQFKQLQAAEKDAYLLEWWLRPHTALHSSRQISGSSPLPEGEGILKLPGAGLFFNDSDFAPVGRLTEPHGDCQTKASAKSILTSLHAQLELQHGSGFLQRRKIELTTAIQHLSIVTNGTKDYRLSERYTDLLTGLLALRVIEEMRPLTNDACQTLTGPAGHLDPQKTERLNKLQQQLMQSAQNLVVSKRPDWGYALLVTMSRLVALQQTLQSGQWVFVDDFSADSTVIAAEDMMRFADELSVQRKKAETDWQQQWQSLGNTELDEQHYSQLEVTSNRYHEWLVSNNRQTLRYHGEQALPVKAINLPTIALPEFSSQQLQQALHQQVLDTQQLTQQLEQNYAYHLLTRNCVTEIFHTINQALGAETQQRLGGVIDEHLNIVPFTAFAMVQASYPVKHITVLPSHRQQQLAKQYEQEFPPLVYARESNVVSASLYDYNPDDAWFVFFTDDALLLRPIFGAINSVAGVGQSLFGLVKSPFDEGQLLATGMRGLLMSLPELAFINMRKGSYKFLSPDSASPENLPGQ
ncbi:MAG: hypothetical protein Q8S55_24460 [Methylococcaceae bacterium]|nr:hypothetical protein [Methylococcaceae bacterium]